MGLIRQASALRVKYRIGQRQTLPIRNLDPHPRNRAGVYPSPDTVIGLGCDPAKDGFSSDEANHLGVCVQEVLGSDQTPLYETYDAYNKRHCAAVAALSTCFPAGEQVVYGTLPSAPQSITSFGSAPATSSLPNPIGSRRFLSGSETTTPTSAR